MNRNSGFTLLEAMLATTILSVGITVVMASLSTSFNVNLVTEEQSIAITTISNQVNRLKSLEYDNSDPAVGDIVAEFGLAGSMHPSYFGVPELIADAQNKDVFNALVSGGLPFPPYGPYTDDDPVIPGVPDGWNALTEDMPAFEIGREPALGMIVPVAPDGNPAALIEFTISLDYMSELGGLTSEKVVVWVSPLY